MIKHLIHKKINEVFLAVQKDKGITDGGIEPFDGLRLEELEEELTELIEKVTDYQLKGHSASYTYETSEGIECQKTFKHINIDKFFTEVSNIIAFSDCTGYTVTNICFDGKEVEYGGWQPNMRFEYEDMDCNTVWFGVFEHWDH